jgi:uncharacterized protein YndB with AHSA1/START domain
MSVTNNHHTVVEAETFSVRRTINIGAPIEKVWAAITHPEQVSRWFGRLELDGASAGASGTISWPDRDPIPLRIEEIAPQRMIAYRWGNDDAAVVKQQKLDDAHSTTFTFTLEPLPDGTRLTVVEAGFETLSDPASDMESHREGWDSELDKLSAFLTDSV